MNDKLDAWLSKLNDSLRLIVKRRLGLRGRDIGTLEAVGNEHRDDSRASAPDSDRGILTVA
ncbi:MAG: DNA-directed RNA polymerase sigma subunit (sigma70/sigma32) [Gammaproteobacteria bacterium]|jgi:DNA-directed RNA polymerase sigma subunit (sigma70/sigma32)